MASANRDELIAQALKSGVPEHDIEGLVGWILEGADVGSFLLSVLLNDLKESVLRADGENIRCLPQIVSFLWNFAPEGCWGSPTAVKRWMRQGGLNGLLAKSGGRRA